LRSLQTKIEKDLLFIVKSGIKAASSYHAISENLTIEKDELLIHSKFQNHCKFSLNDFNHIYIIGAGKASASMASAMEDLFKEKIYQGIVISTDGHCEKLNKITCYEAGHPVPDQRGITYTQEIIQLIDSLKEKDLLFCLISGGGSSLLIQPQTNISLDDMRLCTTILIKSGASIKEINCIRKHISRIKGGQITKRAYPSSIITLAISDVVGDHADVIASGPTVPDISTYSQALQVIVKFDLIGSFPDTILNHLQMGSQNKFPETLKKNDLENLCSKYFLVGNNQLSLDRCKAKAENLGYNVHIITSKLKGDVREIAQRYSAILRNIAKYGNPISAPACILSGGESTVQVTGSGIGGRNQELAMIMAKYIKNMYNTAFLSVGTDGLDGPTDVAGAIVTNQTMNISGKKNIDYMKYLTNNDSYNFFTKIGGHIKTGPTKTNVMDLQAAVISQPE